MLLTQQQQQLGSEMAQRIRARDVLLINETATTNFFICIYMNK